MCGTDRASRRVKYGHFGESNCGGDGGEFGDWAGDGGGAGAGGGGGRGFARRGEKLKEVTGEIEKSGGKALAVEGDATKVKDIETLLARAENFSAQLGSNGRLDIVVVNAGRGLAGGLLSSDEKQWREMYELNVLGAAALMRRAGELMVRQERGDIVVLGSVSGHNVSPFSGFYGSTKFAIAGMAEAFRREVCAKGVRVTVIKPAIVESEFQAVAGYTPENFYKGVARFGKLLEPAMWRRRLCSR